MHGNQMLRFSTALVLAILTGCVASRPGGWPGPTASDEEHKAAIGEQLFQRIGCAVCHQRFGQGTGPKLAGIIGSEVEIEGRGTVVVDEAYLRESILDSQKNLVAGYPKVMPIYRGVLGPEQVDALIAYIESL